MKAGVWMLVTVMGVGCGVDSTRPRPAAGRESGGERIVAQRAAQKLLAPLLVAPSTAVYPWEEIRSAELPCKAGRAWLVEGVVDAKNALGVALRHSWHAVVFDRDGAMFPIYLEMEGQVVFGSALALAEAGIGAAAVEESQAPKRPVKPPEPELREWRDASGQFRVEARFRGAAVGKVKLERENGEVVEVAIDRLSEEDQDWIRGRVR